MIAEKIADAVMAKMGLTPEDIEKARTIMSKIEFTKEDGNNVINVNLGEGSPVASIVNGDKSINIDIGTKIHVIIDKD